MKPAPAFNKMVPLIVGMHSTASFGSALVFKNPLDRTIYVMSTMVYYGPKASMDLALKTSKEISLYWNGGSHGKPTFRPFYATVDGERYQVIFKISTKVMSTEAARRPFPSLFPGGELHRSS